MSFRYTANPHNSLHALAKYHRDTIAAKLDSGNPDGITLDSISAVIAMAFFTEALINYVGSRCVPHWKERDHSPVKLVKITHALGIALDIHVEPFATIVRLRTVRNAMAHGKPEVRRIDAASRSELNRATRTPWGEAVEPEQVLAMYEQLMVFRARLFERSGMTPAQTWDSALGGY